MKHLWNRLRHQGHRQHPRDLPLETDERILACVAEVCRAYSGEKKLTDSLSVVYRVTPTVYVGMIELNISFRYTNYSCRDRSAYAMECVHTRVDEYCHNFPAQALCQALSEALEALLGGKDRVPNIEYRKMARIEWD